MAFVFARTKKIRFAKQLARMTLRRMLKLWRPFIFCKTFSIQASACPQELAAALRPQAS